MRASQSRRGPVLVVAGVMLWLSSLAVTALPQLHELLHKDAQALNHHCLVTQLQQHSLTSVATAIDIPSLTQNSFWAVHTLEFQFLPTQNHRLSSSRAPPASSSLQSVVG